jgi:hypothetical protein
VADSGLKTDGYTVIEEVGGLEVGWFWQAVRTLRSRSGRRCFMVVLLLEVVGSCWRWFEIV